MAVLFDLDGTLFDTSLDIHEALNMILTEHNHPLMEYEAMREHISYGGKRILASALKLDIVNNKHDISYVERLNLRFAEIYSKNQFNKTLPFPGIEELLTTLDKLNIKWGIVTNRLTALAEPLLKSKGYLERSACLVCGDTTNRSKPHPEPLLYACKLLKVAPQDCLYIGDADTDIQAGKAAGMQTMAVGFGFVPKNVNIEHWQADYIAQTAAEILPWIEKWSKKIL